MQSFDAKIVPYDYDAGLQLVFGFIKYALQHAHNTL
jgi:hypothetical protein